MKNFTKSDYALNKYSEGIVYCFADGIREITLGDYLAENRNKTEEDFKELKALSDSIYLDQARDENAQTKNNLSFEEIEDTVPCHAQSTEECFIAAIDAQKKAKIQKKKLILIKTVLDKLTDTERRRYLLYVVKGLNERQISELDHKTQQAISKSLLSVEKKIKKILANL